MSTWIGKSASLVAAASLMMATLGAPRYVHAAAAAPGPSAAEKSEMDFKDLAHYLGQAFDYIGKGYDYANTAISLLQAVGILETPLTTEQLLQRLQQHLDEIAAGADWHMSGFFVDDKWGRVKAGYAT